MAAARPGRSLVLFGPTAVGKTAVALALARRFDGEIVSADSRAFFVGLDIVTDKPTADERREIPHHLIDHVPFDGSYDAMAFRRDVERLIPEIRERGRVPIIAGGGTVYLGALLRGLFDGPTKDEALRREMDARPLEELVDELRRVDPEAARSIHPNDRLRIMRALEVYRSSGIPISRWQAEARPLTHPLFVVGLTRSRDEHRAAIEARARRMIDAGLFDEVARLRAAGLRSHHQAYRTIGIPEAIAHLDGNLTLDGGIERIVHRTWQLARRQTAWFRREKDVLWIDVTGRTADGAADEIAARWREGEGIDDAG